MNTIEKIKKLEWTKNWEGDFSILSAISPMGVGVYNKDMKKYFGINIPNTLVIHKSGTTSCYLVDSELNKFGKGLFKIVKQSPSLIEKWCDKLKLETDKIVANPKTIPPHCTGAAVDITLVDKNFKELNMGTKINAISDKTYTCAKDIPEISRINRNLLIHTMKKVGFVNYPLEWWHWSYGDRIYTFYKNKKYAIYGLKNLSRK